MIILCADAQARYGDLDGARERYTKAVQRYDLDWPEAVFEAFTTFENVHGSLETVLSTRKHITQAQKKLSRRREREAQAQAAEQAAYAQQQADAVAAAAAAEPVALAVEVVSEPMVVDGAPATVTAEVVQPAAAEVSAPAVPVTAAPAPATAPATAQDNHADGEAQVKR